MIVCTNGVVFPQRSVAIQVLVNVYVLAQAPSVLTSLEATVAVPQLSVAVNTLIVGTAEHSTVNGVVGNVPTNIGVVVSWTVTVWV